MRKIKALGKETDLYRAVFVGAAPDGSDEIKTISAIELLRWAENTEEVENIVESINAIRSNAPGSKAYIAVGFYITHLPN